MDFKNYKGESKKLGINTGDYYKLQTGENKIRILSAPEPTVTHFIAKGTAPVPCVTGCDLCVAGNKRSFKIVLYILDRADETIKFAELPWGIFKALGELAASSEYGFEGLPPYDLIITKTGELLETKYVITPGRNEAPLTAAQIKDLAGKKPIKDVLANKFAKQDSATKSLESTADIEEDLPFN